MRGRKGARLRSTQGQHGNKASAKGLRGPSCALQNCHRKTPTLAEPTDTDS
jgi:hypothetical protein